MRLFVVGLEPELAGADELRRDTVGAVAAVVSGTGVDIVIDGGAAPWQVE